MSFLLESFLSENSPMHIQKKLELYFAERVSGDELKSAGTILLALLMPIILDNDSNRIFSASELAARIIGVPWKISASQTPLEQQKRQKRWREWWFQNERNFVVLPSSSSFIVHFSETRFGKWCQRLGRGNMGYSIRDGRAVSAKIFSAAPNSIWLGGVTFFLAYIFGILYAIFLSAYNGRRFHGFFESLLIFFYSIPSFWLAIFMVFLFCGVGVFNIFPIQGLGGVDQGHFWANFTNRIWHMVLPVICFGLAAFAVVARHQYTALQEVLSQPYIFAARARGLNKWRTLFNHGLRNSLLPTISLAGVQLPYFFGGSVLIEKIFNINGIGLLAYESFLARDYPVIIALTLFASLLTLLGQSIAEIFYQLANPQLRRQGQG